MCVVVVRWGVGGCIGIEVGVAKRVWGIIKVGGCYKVGGYVGRGVDSSG